MKFNGILQIVTVFCLVFGLYQHADAGEHPYFDFAVIHGLPENENLTTQPGLAGLYSGVDDGVLIVCGGANFPDKMPWEGGDKKYYDEIFLLKKQADGDFHWEKTNRRIPFASAYGGTVETPHGLLCFGGNTNKKSISESWFIDYNPENGAIQINSGPGLPLALTNFAFATIDGYLYVAGGLSDPSGSAEKVFFRLPVTGDNPSDWKWERLPVWPGAPRAFAVGAGQSNGVTNSFYMFSGRNIQDGKVSEIFLDGFVFDPSEMKWEVISSKEQKKFPVMGGTAFAMGASSIVFPSGADGRLMKRELAIKKKIAETKNQVVIDSLQNRLTNHLNNHPGFGNRILIFNTITGEIFDAGKSPVSGQVTTSAVKWNESIFIPSGEKHPGVRTPVTLKIDIQKNRRHFNFLDVIVIVIYFLTLALMGWYFSKRQKTTNDYFKGGGRVPWWAAGLSIFGTALSAITFMAIPAKTFATDWSYFMFNMTIFLVAPIIVFVFIPFYRKLNITTAYEYLEKRFNLIVRLIGSLSFILFQVGRMGVVMFLPSIALNVVTGIDIFVCIGLMGVVSLVYTMLGGIEAVIWTDVMQVIVLLGGAILSLVLIIFALDGGFGTIVETAAENHKFNIVDLTLSLKQPTIWVMLIGGMFANFTTYGTDQTMVQRYLTTKSVKNAKQSVWTNAILVIPATLIFFFAGTALFVFYKTFPDELNPAFQNNDAIFPWYIASQLPAGISGLLIAGIFAAAMSSLSSSMNSAATAYATDIHFRFKLSREVGGLRIARIATLIIGLVGILFALVMASMDVKSLWDEFQKILGLVIGSLGGVFLLGILTKKANSPGVIIGIIASVVVQIIVSSSGEIHLILYAATGVISCFVTGYLASFLFESKSKNHHS